MQETKLLKLKLCSGGKTLLWFSKSYFWSLSDGRVSMNNAVNTASKKQRFVLLQIRFGSSKGAAHRYSRVENDNLIHDSKSIIRG